MNMIDESKTAKFIRGLVKFVFIACYVAFMWASIHKVAYFFSNFEADSGNMLGSYGLAGAFDITALVTTIGVMFFRKSMPGHVQWIIWGFIGGIAALSYLMNWEYDAHFQSVSLTMQVTGALTPVYDTHGMLHYVPVMAQNILLLIVNPLLAASFTILSLIYSIVAEFFGTKPPTIEELTDRKRYLEETSTVLESIRQLEGKSKRKGLITTLKEKAIESKEAWKEVTKSEESIEETLSNPERNTDKIEALTSHETGEQWRGNEEESTSKQSRKTRGNEEEFGEQFTEENVPLWLSTGGSTICLQTVTEQTNIPLRTLRNRVGKREIRATKNKDIVYKASLIAWMKGEGYIQASDKKARLTIVGDEEETGEQWRGNEEESERKENESEMVSVL